MGKYTSKSCKKVKSSGRTEAVTVRGSGYLCRLHLGSCLQITNRTCTRNKARCHGCNAGRFCKLARQQPAHWYTEAAARWHLQWRHTVTLHNQSLDWEKLLCILNISPLRWKYNFDFIYSLVCKHGSLAPVRPSSICFFTRYFNYHFLGVSFMKYCLTIKLWSTVCVLSWKTMQDISLKHDHTIPPLRIPIHTFIHTHIHT